MSRWSRRTAVDGVASARRTRRALQHTAATATAARRGGPVGPPRRNHFEISSISLTTSSYLLVSNLLGARLVRSRDVDVAPGLAEGDFLFLLAVFELRVDDHHWRLEARLGGRAAERRHVDVGEIGQRLVDLFLVGIARVGAHALPGVGAVGIRGLHQVEHRLLASARDLDVCRVERAHLEDVMAAVVVDVLLEIVGHRLIDRHDRRLRAVLGVSGALIDRAAVGRFGLRGCARRRVAADEECRVRASHADGDGDGRFVQAVLLRGPQVSDRC